MTLEGCVIPVMVRPAAKMNPATKETISSAVFRLKNGDAPIPTPATAVVVFILILAPVKCDAP